MLRIWNQGLGVAILRRLAMCLGLVSELEMDMRPGVVLDRVLVMVRERFSERKAAWQAVLLLVQEIWTVWCMECRAWEITGLECLERIGQRGTVKGICVMTPPNMRGPRESIRQSMRMGRPFMSFRKRQRHREAFRKPGCLWKRMGLLSWRRFTRSRGLCREAEGSRRKLETEWKGQMPKME